MRFFGMTVVAVGTLALAACAGGDNKAADTAAVTTTDSSVTSTTTPAATAPATTAPAAGALAPAPITGKTVEVRMIGDDKGYRFEPSNVVIKQGDGVKFINAVGGPHNVALDPATIPVDVKAQIVANMANAPSELSSPMLTNPNDSYTISFANVKPGTYGIYCTPHLAMNMKGTITVQ